MLHYNLSHQFWDLCWGLWPMGLGSSGWWVIVQYNYFEPKLYSILGTFSTWSDYKNVFYHTNFASYDNIFVIFPGIPRKKHVHLCSSFEFRAKMSIWICARLICFSKVRWRFCWDIFLYFQTLWKSGSYFHCYFRVKTF